MPSPLLPLIDKLNGRRVLCVGDVMLDHFVYGTASRLSPEAPVPVLHAKERVITLGGHGNMVNNLAVMGGKVELVSVMGDDEGGRDLNAEIAKNPNINSHMVVDPDRPTIVKTRFVCGQQLLRVDWEKTNPLPPDIRKEVLARIEKILPTVDIVVMSDYLKGVLKEGVAREVINMATKAGKKILIDPKGADFSAYRGATFLTPNRKALADLVDFEINTPADAEKAARKIIGDNDLGGLLVKLDKDGIGVVCKDSEMLFFKSKADKVVEVSGAGDTVLAAFALSLAAELPLEQATEIASVAGGIVVGKPGTATVSTNELIAYLQSAGQ
jgi:D-beta-D-heptose 7-phosphate kinase/D-beta-D-heptose 1-phosphate adenosyltransferase